MGRPPVVLVKENPSGSDAAVADFMLAWARETATGEPRYILEIDDQHRGADCGCECPSCGLPLVAVNAARTQWVRRPHFRHPAGAQKQDANLLADSLAAFVALYPAIALELDLSARRLAVFPAGLYAAPSYLARQDALRQLRGNGEPAAWTLVQGEQRWHGVPAGRAAANSPELLIRLARAGAGIAAVPEHFASPDVRQGRLRRVLPQWCLPSATAWAVFAGGNLMPAKTRVFIDMLVVALGGGEDSA